MAYSVARTLLFLLPPERAHAVTLSAVRTLGRISSPRSGTVAPVAALGLSFANRVGLAAGFDKNGTAVDGWFALGFGHVEVGTVTPRPQPGAPIPRLFRIPALHALINRMGFPNEGAERIAARLRSRQRAGIVGVSIGKNAVTPLERAVDDYVFCLRTLYPVADYVAVNVSSPNTAGLRSLQDAGQLTPLLSALAGESRALEKRYSRRVPLLLKLSPDLPDEELCKAGAVAAATPMAGVIATNSTLSREGVLAEPLAREAGGLSGRPLLSKAIRTVRILRTAVGPTMPVFGVGGVTSGIDARLLREAGADLVQIYTGLVYRGPRLVRELADALGPLRQADAT